MTSPEQRLPEGAWELRSLEQVLRLAPGTLNTTALERMNEAVTRVQTPAVPRVSSPANTSASCCLTPSKPRRAMGASPMVHLGELPAWAAPLPTRAPEQWAAVVRL